MAISNYEVTKRKMQKHFLDYDQEKMIEKFGLAHDDAYLYILFAGRSYRISRQTGLVEWSEDAFLEVNEGNYNEAMSIYDLLCCSQPDCRLSGDYVTCKSLPGVAVAGSPGSELFSGNAAYFAGKGAQLAKACEKLGGKPAGKGDVAYELPAFDCLPVRLVFWDADEEFPASLYFLWDRNTTRFIHFETTFYVAAELTRRLEEEMGK